MLNSRAYRLLQEGDRLVPQHEGEAQLTGPTMDEAFAAACGTAADGTALKKNQAKTEDKDRPGERAASVPSNEDIFDAYDLDNNDVLYEYETQCALKVLGFNLNEDQIKELYSREMQSETAKNLQMQKGNNSQTTPTKACSSNDTPTWSSAPG